MGVVDEAVEKADSGSWEVTIVDRRP